MVVYTQDKYIGENKTVGIQYNDVTAPIVPHQHTFIEIAYISEGEGTEWVNDRCYEVKRGDVIFINYGDTHTFAPRDSFSHYEIFFAPKLVEDGVITPANALTLLSLSTFGELLGEDGVEKLSFRGEERREIEFILSAMLREYAEEKEDADTVLTHYLNVLLTKFRRASQATSSDDAIEDIFYLAASVGIKNVSVIIAPYDMRKGRNPELERSSLAWYPDLLCEISTALGVN